MKTYTSVYYRAFGYDESDRIICELCTRREAVDISHIFPKSTYPQLRDSIEVLVASCRECHTVKGDLPQWRNWSLRVHRKHMDSNGVKYSDKLMDELIRKTE